MVPYVSEDDDNIKYHPEVVVWFGFFDHVYIGEMHEVNIKTISCRVRKSYITISIKFGYVSQYGM